MSLIARCYVKLASDGKTPLHVRSAPSALILETAGDGEIVEMIPAEQLRGAVEALYSAHDFIGRVTKWTGTDEDERDDLLAEIARHLPQGGQ